MKQNIRRFAAATLSALLVFGSAIPVSAASAVTPIGDGRTPTVDEAYYATLDYYGNLTEGSIVKSYVLNGATSITDYGEYESVANLTDGTAPSEGAKRVAFDFTGASAVPTHFYFEGKTAQPFQDLPWALSVSYKLNGVPMKAEDLAGKTGVVEIDVDAIPNKSAGDYVRHNYTLEAMAIFNQDDILSLEAPGAQVQLLGNLRAVLFLAFPGEEGHFVIRVGAEDFSFGGMTFLMVPATLSQLEEISKLAERKEDLEDSYDKLSGSLDTLLDSLSDVSGSLYASANGLDALGSAVGTVSAGKGAVYDAADAAITDVDSLSAALEPLSGEIAAANDTLSEANDVVRELTKQTLELRGELDKLKKALNNMRDNRDDLIYAIEELDQMQTSLRSMAAKLGNITDTSGASGAKSPLIQQLTQAEQTYITYNAMKALQGDKEKMDAAEFAYAALILSGQAADTEAAAELYNKMAPAAAGVAAAMQSGADQETAIKTVAKKSVDDIATATITEQLQAAGYTGETLTAAVAAQLSAYQASEEYQETLADAVSSVASAASFIGKAKTGYAAGNGDNELEKFDQFLTSMYTLCGGLAADATAAGKTAEAKAYTEKAGEAAFLKQLWTSDPIVMQMLLSDPNTVKNLTTMSKNIGALTSIAPPTANVLRQLAYVCDKLGELDDTIYAADDIVALAAADTEKIKAILDEVEKLDALLDEYEPTAAETLDNIEAMSAELAATTKDANAFLKSLRDLLKRSGSQIDAGTQQALSGLSAALRSTAKSLGTTDDVRDAKADINDLIEDTWNDYTGDVNDLLEIDANATIVSLTDPRNPSPQSVQVLLRTQEIKAADDAPAAVSAATVSASSVTDAAPSTFWGRVAAMFTSMWYSVVALFRK